MHLNNPNRICVGTLIRLQVALSLWSLFKSIRENLKFHKINFNSIHLYLLFTQFHTGEMHKHIQFTNNNFQKRYQWQIIHRHT